MLILLQDQSKKILIGVEFFIDALHDEHDHRFLELQTIPHLLNYSKFLLDLPAQVQMKFADDIYEISEMRGWLFNAYEHGGIRRDDDINDQYEEALSLLRKKLKKVAQEWDLIYTED